MPHRSNTQFAASAQESENPTQESGKPMSASETQTNPGEFNVSVSELLGYDYIFITNPLAPIYFSQDSRAVNTLQEYVELLDITPAQSVFMSVDDSEPEVPRFTRHDIEWVNAQPTKINSTIIDDAEQQAFMQMIWQGSAPCAL